jgi:anti-sigma regulatory factor (Ser/Thr protein kinase)
MNALSAELAGTPESARAARDLVRWALGDHHPSADDAQVLVSELVSNAIAHSRSGQPGGKLTVAVEASADSQDVFIRVNDAGAPAQPTLRAPRRDTEGGRGLRIVAALAADWGTETSGSGRSTWCRIIPEPDRNAVHPRPGRAKSSRTRQATRQKTAQMVENNGPRMVDGYVMNYGGPPSWSCVVQINEALRGRTQPNGMPIADMWPEALHRSWDAQREADREAEP